MEHDKVSYWMEGALYILARCVPGEKNAGRLMQGPSHQDRVLIS